MFLHIFGHLLTMVQLYGLKITLAGDESDSSAEYHHPQSDPSTRELASSIQELDRTPSERHAFFFRHNLGSNQSDGQEFHPLPSQIPFLLNTYAENVNIFSGVVHMPTIDKMVRGLRGSRSSALAPADEALLFSIYYAAVISMEEDDVSDRQFPARRLDIADSFYYLGHQ